MAVSWVRDRPPSMFQRLLRGSGGKELGSGDAGELGALAETPALRRVGPPGPGLGSAGGVPVLQRARRPCVPDSLRVTPPGPPGRCGTASVRAVAQGGTYP